MGTVDGLTAEAMAAIRDGVVVDGNVDGTSGHLLLTRYDGTTIDAGNVKGDQGDVGPTGPTSILIINNASERPTTGPDLFEGLVVYQKDAKINYQYDGTTWKIFQAGIPHSTVAKMDTSLVECTDSTYTPFDHPVVVGPFAKFRDDTKIIATYHGAIRNNNAWGEYGVAVHDDLTDTNHIIVRGLGDLGPKSGSIEIVTLDAGTYTFELRRALLNGAGVVFDGQINDNLQSLTITETF